jgi:hypothetical protein
MQVAELPPLLLPFGQRIFPLSLSANDFSHGFQDVCRVLVEPEFVFAYDTLCFHNALESPEIKKFPNETFGGNCQKKGGPHCPTLTTGGSVAPVYGTTPPS